MLCMKPGDVVAAFDRMAASYDTWYATPLGTFVDAREKDAIFRLAEVRPGEQALDVGCGTGNYTLALAERGAWTVGVDPAPAMLGMASDKARKARRPAAFARAVAEELPFARSRFDLVVSVTTLEFTGSPEEAVAEMMRVLAPGGRLVVGVLNAWSLWALEYGRQKGTIYEKAHFFNPFELTALLRPYGRMCWRSCVFIPPWPLALPRPVAAALEQLGSATLAPFGAFLVARVEKRSKSLPPQSGV